MSRQTVAQWSGVVLAAALALSACSSGGSSTASVSSAPASMAPTRSEALQTAIAGLPADIASSGVLTVATDPQLPPDTYTDDRGAIVGWETELTGLVAQRLGLHAKFVAMPFGSIIPGVRDGSVNLGVSTIFDTAEREKDVDMVTYYRAGTSWAALLASSITPDTACGSTVAAIADTLQATTDLPARSDACIANGKKPITISTFRTQEAATESLLNGMSAAIVGDSPAISYAVQQSRGQLKPVGAEYDVYLYGMATAKDAQGLTSAVQAALESLQNDGTYDRLLGKWGVEGGGVSSFGINVPL